MSISASLLLGQILCFSQKSRAGRNRALLEADQARAWCGRAFVLSDLHCLDCTSSPASSIQSIQIEIINASWLLTHFFRRLDTYWEAWSLLRFPQTPGMPRQAGDRIWYNMEQSKNLHPIKAQDIQKCIHWCARYPRIYPRMRKICNAASKFWLHQMQRAVLHQPQGREAGAWQYL